MSVQFGAFGKIPALGDFFRLNVAAGFVQLWDTWLQSCILDARSTLGDGWTDAYLSAPIWRFTLSAGVVGDAPVMGILMASVDRVGRQYPLTLAATCPDENVPRSHFANTPVFEALEQVALAMLEDGTTKDTLSEALAPIQPISTPTRMDNLPFCAPIPFEHAAAGQILSDRLGPDGCLWSTAMQGDHRLFRTRNLPDGPERTALFDLSHPMWHKTSAVEFI
ncbi:MAG: type VI secretion system-associated protein TagF [Tateyamaria sp.]